MPSQQYENHKKYIQTLEGNASKTMTGITHRCKTRGWPAPDFDRNYLVQLWHSQEGKCALTGFDMLIHAKQKTPGMWFTWSVERVDSSQGYSKDNIILVCNAVNKMKNNMPIDLFLTMVRAIANKED